MTNKVLHFTLGPVQDFIADARRLRDFWAGSFLLSVLAGHAMVAAVKGGAEIAFPEVKGDALFEALRGAPNDKVYIGSLPNRFKANLENKSIEQAKEIARQCVSAVDHAWRKLCDEIWNTYVKGAAEAQHGVEGEANPTRIIWVRQTGNFWDMAWVVGEDPKDNKDGNWLDIRKNWRTVRPKVLEGGDHCRLMGQYQELSGFNRFPSEQRKRQNEFWDKVRKLGKISELDLPDGEYLCALALIKRLFPVLLEKNEKGIAEVVPWRPGGDKLNIRHWPSTSYVAALPWLKAIAGKADGKIAADIYAKAAGDQLKSILSETETQLYRLPADPFFKLDGHLLHESGVIALVKERFGKSKSNDAQSAKEGPQVALGGALWKLGDELGITGLPKRPSTFYAILKMDGDSIGSLLGDHSNLIKIGLAKFTEKVKTYFDPKTNIALGVLVYAGGDDVLAILPVDTAITAACAIRKMYTQAFEEAGASAKSIAKFTLSGAIVYSRFNTPLTQALRQAGITLDQVAKDKNGRNSLALCVMKPGGVAAQWVDVFDTSETGGPKTIERLATDGFGKQNTDAQVSGGFFHGLRDHYRDIFAPRNNNGEADDSKEVADFETQMLGDNVLLTSLIKADLKRQFGNKTFDEMELESTVTDVLTVLRPKKSDNNHQIGVEFDGGLIVRFLASEARSVKVKGQTDA